jgi:hypothetical protein
MEFNWGHDEASCPQLNTLSMMWNQYKASTGNAVHPSSDIIMEEAL